VDLYKLQHRLGGLRGLIRQCEFFLYQERDREAVRRCQELGYEFPEVTGWIRATHKDFELAKNMGLREVGILTSVSDYHIFHKWEGMTRSKALEQYLSVIKDALNVGIIPRCHFEDMTRADFYGFVVPFAIELRRLSEESGIQIKIRACDTMGFGVPYPGASMPRSVPGIIYGLNHLAGVPSELLEWHGHNDFHKVVVNSAMAWLYGCSAVNGTLLGIGERTGNAPIEGMVMEYLALRGPSEDVDTTVISEIARYMRDEVGYHIPENQPFVGAHFNTTLAGIHADGLSKDQRIYTIFDTKALLGVPPGIRISDKSSLAGVAYWINTTLELEGDEAVTKLDPAVEGIYKNIAKQYESGRVAVMSDVELLNMLIDHKPELAEKAKTHLP
jgi:isopropylmalate/homocitrate/citramalate synthase